MSSKTQSDMAANRLTDQTSPYLLQHAKNPVHWQPWGQEAIDEARRRDVPIFLSIGYSTCYWCHVMERESFEDEATARIMNEHFVCVKVDREERPDLDEAFMAATVIMTGRGGWPMSVFIEPAGLRPFWCGTYFPPKEQMSGGMPSFTQVLLGMAESWAQKRDEVLVQSQRLGESVEEQSHAHQEASAIGIQVVQGAVQRLLGTLDRTNGGFSGAPKFPQPVFLEFLLDVRERAGDDATREAVDQALRLTLDKMAMGGIHDHVGGGFHRYSVDAFWIVPHFEKMLYDNAQLASVYARAARAYDDSWYAYVAQRTVEYVLGEMTSPDGAFFSAQDAEVDGREGLNYLWTQEQMRESLDEAEAEFAIKVYGLDAGPNFKDPHHPDEGPANVLRLADRPERVAQTLGMDESSFASQIESVNTKLYKTRQGRKQPHLDDKVLASWNGLMIGAMAQAGMLLEKPEYVQAAKRAATFVLREMMNDATLVRSWRGKIGGRAFLEDYACVAHGLMALSEALGADGAAYQAAASHLLHRSKELFGDEGSGAYFDMPAGHDGLFVRMQSAHDGAMPCASSVLLHALVNMHAQTGETPYKEEALGLLRALSGAIGANPLGTVNSTRGLLRMLSSDRMGHESVLFGDAESAAKATPQSADFTPVEIWADTDAIEVGPDRPAQVSLAIQIAEGYHITAAEPGPAGQELSPLRVHVVGGSGINVYADYPPGQAAANDDQLRVHSDRIDFCVAVEDSGEQWTGRPLLAVTFQACSDTECLEVCTVELAVRVDQASSD